MTEAYLNLLVKHLRRTEDELEPGLSDLEVAQIEARYDIRFPPDLCRLLQRVLPVSDFWVDWRDDSEKTIRAILDRPIEGICSDIVRTSFWRREWGRRPPSMQEALEVARAKLAEAPRLIPISPDLYIPDDPHLEGNPVFSVHETDVFYFGYDLASFFVHQLSFDPLKLSRQSGLYPDWIAKKPRPIRLWSSFVDSFYAGEAGL
jgi:hypothetical protein